MLDGSHSNPGPLVDAVGDLAESVIARVVGAVATALVEWRGARRRPAAPRPRRRGPRAPTCPGGGMVYAARNSSLVRSVNWFSPSWYDSPPRRFVASMYSTFRRYTSNRRWRRSGCARRAPGVEVEPVRRHEHFAGRRGAGQQEAGRQEGEG